MVTREQIARIADEANAVHADVVVLTMHDDVLYADGDVDVVVKTDDEKVRWQGTLDVEGDEK